LDTVEAYSRSLKDPDLREALTHGIAVFHEGLRPEEQRIALELFGSGLVRVLIASREACWTLPVRASLVVVMSAQFASLQPSGGEPERTIQDYPMPELLQMQSLAVPPSQESSADFLVLCQKDQADLYSKYLQQGVSLESDLPFSSLLSITVLSDLVSDRIHSRQDIVDLLSWTFLARRLEHNPSYYALAHHSPLHDSPSLSSQLSRLADMVLAILESRCCITIDRNDFVLSKLGKSFTEKLGGGAVEEIERLQGIELDELFTAVVPKRKKKEQVKEEEVEETPNQEPTPGEATAKKADSKKQASKKKPKEPETPLSQFLQRLPRSIKNDIGEKPDDFEDGDWETRVLLAAFRAGRLPRNESLEKTHLQIVDKLVRSRI